MTQNNGSHEILMGDYEIDQQQFRLMLSRPLFLLSNVKKRIVFRESNKREKKKAGWLLINDDGLMVKTVTLHFGMGRKGDNTYQHSMLDEMKKVQFRMSSPFLSHVPQSKWPRSIQTQYPTPIEIARSSSCKNMEHGKLST